MAGSKVDKDTYFGLTPSQVKLILLGALFMEEGGKPDWKRMAKKANLTFASVRSMYPKAMKRLHELQDPDETPQDTNTATTEYEEVPRETPKPKKTHGPGRKRKRVEETPAPEVEEPAYEPEAQSAPGIEQSQYDPGHGFEAQGNDDSTVNDEDEAIKTEDKDDNTEGEHIKDEV